MEFNKKLVLEDGSEYYGYGFGADCEKVCELVFNTSMVGYQEIMFNPSCADQAVLMTYTIIGNYGITDEDMAKKVSIGAILVYDYNDNPSNFRYTKSLSDFAEENGVPGLYGFETRKLSRYLRDNGTCRAILTDAGTPADEAVKKIKETPVPHDQVSRVSTKKKWYSKIENPNYNVVIIDCGMKPGIVKSLNRVSCNATVVPFDTTPEEISALRPDGIFISNGPGSPDDAQVVVDTVKALKGRYPIFGICLGLGIIAKAYGADVYKLKFGHRGDNHPVRNLATNKIEIVSQHHGFAVCEKSLESTCLSVTHKNVLDGTVEGVACEADYIRGVQFYPEGNPEPRESSYLLCDFVNDMKRWKENA